MPSSFFTLGTPRGWKLELLHLFYNIWISIILSKSLLFCVFILMLSSNSSIHFLAHMLNFQELFVIVWLLFFIYYLLISWMKYLKISLKILITYFVIPFTAFLFISVSFEFLPCLLCVQFTSDVYQSLITHSYLEVWTEKQIKSWERRRGL